MQLFIIRELRDTSEKICGRAGDRWDYLYRYGDAFCTHRVRWSVLRELYGSTWSGCSTNNEGRTRLSSCPGSR